MPELPEVEIIKLGLQQKIVGLTIKEIEIFSAKTFLGNPKEVKGKKVMRVWRRAKMLGIDLDDLTLLFHLKMTGQLIYEDGKRLIGGHPTPDMRDQMPNSSTRVIFEFSDGSKLYFNDQRRFGWVKTVRGVKSGIGSEEILGKLGPEPLEQNFSWQVLRENLLRHKPQPVKVAIMDQTVVAGVGNIYSNEACFHAGINPRAKVGSLSDEDFRKLHAGVIKALTDGIKHGGSTRATFVDPEGKKGYFLDYANVYGKAGYPCPRCHSEIKKIMIGGRGTYFCPHCQKDS